MEGGIGGGLGGVMGVLGGGVVGGHVCLWGCRGYLGHLGGGGAFGGIFGISEGVFYLGGGRGVPQQQAEDPGQPCEALVEQHRIPPPISSPRRGGQQQLLPRTLVGGGRLCGEWGWGGGLWGVITRRDHRAAL